MRNFEKWLGKFKNSIATYDYYIDLKKVIKNVSNIKIELNILNSLIGSKNIEEEFENIIGLFENFGCFINLFVCGLFC